MFIVTQYSNQQSRIKFLKPQVYSGKLAPQEINPQCSLRTNDCNIEYSYINIIILHKQNVTV